MTEYTKNLTKILEQIKDSNPDKVKILVPQFMAKKISTLMLMREDLIFVRETAVKLKETTETSLKENLWYSLIAIYARCFTDSSQSKKPKLEPNDLFSSSEHVNEIETHSKLMEIRHTFLAHRGDNENEIPVVYFEMQKNEEVSDTNSFFRIVSTRYTNESKEFLDSVIALCDFILGRLNLKFKKQADKLLDKLLTLDMRVLEQLAMK